MRLAKRPPSEIDEKVKWAASILSLEPYLKRFPRELSGGQRQRVAMGRAIVRDPSVFLFDEPLSNLDAKLRVQMRTEIKELHQRLKSTTVYVTHDQIEAMTLADQIVILNEGNIEQIGTPIDVYDKPKNLFVAAFIGSPAMNLIEGEVVDGNGGRAVRSGGGELLPIPQGINAAPGQKVVYGVRPEHLGVATTGVAGNAATVNVVEPTGREIHVYATLGGEEVCAIIEDRVELAAGQPIRLLPRLDRVHLFDKASGAAIGRGALTYGSRHHSRRRRDGHRDGVAGVRSRTPGAARRHPSRSRDHRPRSPAAAPIRASTLFLRSPWRDTSSGFAETLATDTDVIVLGVSSAGVGWAIERLAGALKKPVPVVMITKGLDGDGRTIRVLPDVVASELQRQLGFAVPVAAIGGPCIAGELAARRQTGVVVTSRTPGLAQVLADMLSTGYYQPRISDDVIGVEVCAALKNFYAIAVGWANRAVGEGRHGGERSTQPQSGGNPVRAGGDGDGGNRSRARWRSGDRRRHAGRRRPLCHLPGRPQQPARPPPRRRPFLR